MSGIILRNVTKRYDAVPALNNVSLTLESSKIYGLLGRNGAGKSTMLNAITGRIFTNEGEITMAGERIAENDKNLNQIYLLSESVLFPENMKLSDAIKWTAEFYKSFDKEKARDLAKTFELSEKKRFRALSTGYRTIYKLILALSANTPYLFLDEPVLGLDANHRDVFYKALLNRYSDSPCCILLSTHLVEEVSSLLEDVIIIRNGSIIYNGAKDDLLALGYTISGSAKIIDDFTQDKEVLGTDTIGNLKSAYIKGSLPASTPQGTEVSKMDLQKLFIQMTN